MRTRPPSRWFRLQQLIRRLADDRGYTLSELLIVLAILGVIVTSFTAVFASASKAEVDMNRRFQAQQEARLALDLLRREGHCASAVALATAVPTSRVTLTFGPFCRRGIDITARTTVAAAMTAAATTFTRGTVSGTFPSAPFNIQVEDEVMRVTAVSGTTWTVQRGLLGTAAAPHGSGVLVRLGRYAVTWCTTPATGTRRVLRRIDGATSTCAGGRAVADFLTSGGVFSTYAPQSATRRATLGVSFTVDVDPGDSMRIYRLQDDIVLRNTSRTP